MNSIGILDFQSSNSYPLLNTIRNLGYEAHLIDSPSLVDSRDKLIIPGVGHIGSLVRELDSGGYRNPILQHVSSGKFVLGICLGMQALASSSEEDPKACTLGVFSSRVCSLVPDPEMNIRVPHVGWNSVEYYRRDPLFTGIPQKSDFYFTHSFGVGDFNNETIATTEHGNVFASAINFGNVFGVQFHPEKSQKYGEKLLSNFCKL